MPRRGLSALILAILGIYSLPVFSQTQQSEPESAPKVRVGIFDSRAVAIAYYRSEAFKKIMKDLHAQRDKAKAAGDEMRVQELEAQGRALNDLAHKQGFNAASVDHILQTVKNEVAAMAKATHVDLIVSKWVVAYQDPESKVVDLTDSLVKLFQPDEATLKVIQEIRKQAPMTDKDHH